MCCSFYFTMPSRVKKEDSACHLFCRKDVEKFSGADLLVRRAAIKRVQQSLIIRLVAIEFSHITELAPKNAKKHRSLQIMCQQMPHFPDHHPIPALGSRSRVLSFWSQNVEKLSFATSHHNVSMTSHIIHLIDIITLDLHFGESESS